MIDDPADAGSQPRRLVGLLGSDRAADTFKCSATANWRFEDGDSRSRPPGQLLLIEVSPREITACTGISSFRFLEPSILSLGLPNVASFLVETQEAKVDRLV